MPTLTQRISAAVYGFKTGMLTNTRQANRDSYQTDDERLARYAERLGWYRGQVVRSRNSIITVAQSKTLTFNFCRPICGMAAGWAVGPRVQWSVTGETEEQTQELSKIAQDIWDRSEGDGEFLLSALTGAIYGDLVLSVRVREGKVILEWVDPCICQPEFDPGDISRLVRMKICYGEGASEYEEVWTPGGLTISRGEGEGAVAPLELKSSKEIPFAWIPNMAVKGQAFGDSELDAAMPLILEYDHVASKETRIIDRHASPVIKAKNLSKKDAEIDKKIETVWYLSKEGADIEYLEWKGNRPDVKEHLERIRNGLAEVTETPNIAFGQIDSGFSGASGVSLKVLYGPANGKRDRKRSLWGPRIERMMHMAMVEEGHAVEREQVQLVWQDATPQSELEFLQGLSLKKNLGASEEKVLVEAGYSPEDAKQMVAAGEAKAEADAERQARVFSRGSVVE